MRLQLLEQNVGRNLADDVGHEEDRQCGIIAGASFEVQILLKSQNGRIANIDSVRRICQSDRIARLL